MMSKMQLEGDIGKYYYRSKDFEDISQNIISYNNEDSQASSEELNNNKEEVVS